MNALTRTMSCFAMIAMLSACASQPKTSSLRDIPQGTHIQVGINSGGSDAPKAMSTGEGAAAGAAKGTATGAVLGAGYGFVAGFACGPLFMICAPAGAVGGAMGGGVIGLAAGTYSGASLGIPAEKAEQLESIMKAAHEELASETTLVNAFSDSADGFWQVSAEPSDTRVLLALESIVTEQSKEDLIHFDIVVSAQVHFGDGFRETDRKYLFTTSTAIRSVDDWIENDGAAFREDLMAGIVQGTNELAYELGVNVAPVNVQSTPDTTAENESQSL